MLSPVKLKGLFGKLVSLLHGLWSNRLLRPRNRRGPGIAACVWSRKPDSWRRTRRGADGLFGVVQTGI